jgi:hypothetical protein
MTEQTEFRKGGKVYIAVYSGAYSFITEGIFERILPSKRYKVQRKMRDGMHESRILPADRPIFRTRNEAYIWITQKFEAEIRNLEEAKKEFILRDIEEENKEREKK